MLLERSRDVPVVMPRLLHLEKVCQEATKAIRWASPMCRKIRQEKDIETVVGIETTTEHGIGLG